METKSPSAGRVKCDDAQKRLTRTGRFPGFALEEGQKRLRGYLLKIFARGKEFHLWDKFVFHRRTRWIRGQDGRRRAYRRALSVRHIERIVGEYRRICTEFVWEEIRVGRSMRLRVSLANPEHPGLPVYEIRRRLVGYIAAAVDAQGVAKVDAVFLAHFQRATALPMELIQLVWLKTRKMAGFRVRWRGANNGRKLVVSRNPSRTHFCPEPISTYCVSEEIKPKTTGLTPRLDPIKSSASLRAALQNPPATGAAHRRLRNERPANPGARTPNHDPPRWPVLIVCGRPVDGRKLARLAALLAVTRMRAPHDQNWRVEWIFKYTRNLAYRALREGFDVAEIVTAYALGVARSHEDSLDADRAVTGKDGWRREPQRVPSAAVAYAWRELLQDGRDREERWEAIFARGPRTAPPVTAEDIVRRIAPAAVPPPKQIAPPRQRTRLPIGELKNLVAAATKPGERLLEDGPGLTAGELARFLREQKSGMTLGQFNGKARAWRVALVAEARRWVKLQKSV